MTRAALLDAVIESITRNGLGSRSLRDIAADAGTSHRMLIHHFGSREALLVAIVDEVESRQRDILRTLPRDSPAALATMWKQLTDPALWPFERLFFECYARGAQGEAPFDRLVPRLVDEWLALFPRGPQRDQARLGLAVIRGLLLDLVATEDRNGVDRAMHGYLGMLSPPQLTHAPRRSSKSVPR